MLLAHLPTEILGSILSFESSSYLAIRLWKTGNKILMTKLQAGITSVDLRPLPGWKFRLPLFINQLRKLRHLGVHSTRLLLDDPSRGLSLLEALPKSLESLELDVPDAHRIFANTDEKSNLSTSTNGKSSIQSIMSIEALLPRLKTLKFSKNEWWIEALPLFPALPQNLTHLRLTPVNSSEFPFLSLLPRSLQILEVPLKYALDSDALINDWSNAPPNLQRITSIKCPTTKIIPSSLQVVDKFTLKTKKPSQLGPLPSCLKNINLHISPDNPFIATLPQWPTLLPTGLTRLKLVGALLPSQLALLPRSITHLEIKMRSHEWVHFENAYRMDSVVTDDGVLDYASIWPSSLIHLSSSVYSSENMFDVLPKGIKSLNLDCMEEEGPANVSQLPPHLTSLEITHDLELIGSYPSSLTKAKLVNIGQLANPSFSDTLTHLDFRNMNGKCSTNLEIFKEHAPALSNGLLFLKLPVWRHDWFKDIPRSVTSLYIQALRNLTPPSIDDHTTDLFQDLPPNLTSLEMYHALPITFSSASFATLTRLRSLILTAGMSVKAGALSNLPRSMTNLHIEVKELTPSHLPHLPPSLTKIYIGRFIDWTMPNIAEYWPVYAVSQVSEFESEVKRRVLNRLSSIDY